MIKRYKRFFSETFNSQREVYELVDDIVEIIREFYIRAMKDLKVVGANGDQYVEAGLGYIYSNYRESSFPLIKLLQHPKITQKDLAKKFLEFFRHYEPSLRIHILLNSDRGNSAFYVTQGKSIEATLTDKVKEFYNSIQTENYSLAVHQMLIGNDLNGLLNHEFTHMYDDMVSHERAVTDVKSYVKASQDVKGYMSQDIEINARFYSASYSAIAQKIESLFSQQALKRQWERVYWPKFNQTLRSEFLEKDQKNKIYKRAWIEFTTLDKDEEEAVKWYSYQGMLNNGDIKKMDVRLKNKNEVLKDFKNIFINLSNGKTSKNLFKGTEPLMNAEWQDEVYTQIESKKKVQRVGKWKEADVYYNLYNHVWGYGVSDYDTKILDNLIKDLRLDKDIVSKIKNKYTI
jgi:hypothetical protein